MSGPIIIPAMELIPSGVNEPKLIALAAAVAIGGTMADIYKGRQEVKLDTSDQANKENPGFADPFVAEAAKVGNRRTRIAERAGYYAAIACATFATLQWSGPYNSHPKVKGEASIVIDAGHTADIHDMQDSKGAPVSRFQASVDGSLNAAKYNNVPFSFILAGSVAQTIDNTPAHNKNLSHTRQLINKALTPQFRNGNESLANGVQGALPLAGSPTKDVIVVASNLSSKDLNGIQEIKTQLKQSYPHDMLHAIVTGQSDGSEQIGAATLSAPVDMQSFQQLLGTKNVLAAHTTADVQKDITSIIGQAQAAESRQPIDDYGRIAIIVGAAGLVVATRRRLAGITKLIKRRK